MTGSVGVLLTYWLAGIPGAELFVAVGNLIQESSTRTLFVWIFSANGRIWVTANLDSANCRIIRSPQNIAKTFPKVFH